MKGRLLGLAVLATATMATAAQLNAGNITVAEEATVGGFTTKVTNAYQVDQPIAAGNTIKLTVSGAKFSVGSGNPIYLCKFVDGTSNDSTVGNGTVSDGADKANITLSAPIGKGQIYYFAFTSCDADGKTLSDKYIQYNLNNLTDGQTVTLTVSGLDGDVSAPVATIKKQFSAQVDPTTARIDLKNLKNFVSSTNVSATTIKAPFRIISNETIANKLTVTGANGSCTGTLSTGWSANFTLKGKLQEYSAIAILATTGSTVLPQNIEDTDRTNGQVTISNFDLNSNGIVCTNASDKPTYIALKVDGQTQIQEDTKKLTITLKNGSYSSNLLTDATAFIVKLDAKTLYVPLVGVNPATGKETYIKLQMTKNTVESANVTFLILAGDGSIVATYNKTLKAGTALTVTGSELKDAAIKQGKTVGDSFAVKIIVPAPESDIFAYANIVENGGTVFKRVPVKVEGGTIVE
jgi:hypothetical protein